MKHQNRYKHGFMLYGHSAINGGGGFGRNKRKKFHRTEAVELWEKRINKLFKTPYGNQDSIVFQKTSK